MTIIYISDFDLKGSGYMNIGVNLCSELAKRGYEVQAIGFGYNGQEHSFPFRIVTLYQLQDVAYMFTQLKNQGIAIEAVIVALDIPQQEAILKQLNAPNNEFPYIGLFPIEAGPLCKTWALSLSLMDARLVMSKFGVVELEKAGLDAVFIPIGIDCSVWRIPEPEERQLLRKNLGYEDDTFVVLTVADNQERKNLSRSLEIFSDAFKDKNAQYVLVTRPNSPVGWKIPDLAMELGIFSQLSLYDRGMPQKNLWALFAAANCFLLTSKAEGLAMPVLEAMAMRLPVVGTKACAIEEHLAPFRGYLIEPDYIMIDPWGNSNRYIASREDGKNMLLQLQEDKKREDFDNVLDAAQNYIKKRTWQQAGDVLEETLKRVVEEKQPVLA